MTQHTQGPWFVEFSHYEDSPIYIQTHKGVPLGHRESTVCFVHDERNARLIAAAPQLLETLQWLDQIGGLGLTPHARIRAAIAAATGTPT